MLVLKQWTLLYWTCCS